MIKTSRKKNYFGMNEAEIYSAIVHKRCMLILMEIYDTYPRGWVRSDDTGNIRGKKSICVRRTSRLTV